MAFRFLVAGGLLLVAARVAGLAFPASRAAWGTLALLGLLNNALYLGLASVSLRHLSVGTGAVLASVNPLLTGVAAALLLGERLTPTRMGGLLLSFAGVLGVMRSRTAAGDRPWAMLVMLAGIGFLVAGTILFKRLPAGLDLRVANGVQLAAAGVALLPVSGLLEAVGDRAVHPLLPRALRPSWCSASPAWGWGSGSGSCARGTPPGPAPTSSSTRSSACSSARSSWPSPCTLGDLAGSVAVGIGIWIVQRS